MPVFHGRTAHFCLFCLALLHSGPAHPQGALKPITVDFTAFEKPFPVQLEVYINDEPMKLVAALTYHPGKKRLSITRKELREIGIAPPRGGPPSQSIFLDETDIRYRYDEAGQAIYFTVTDGQRAARVYSAHRKRKRVKLTSGFGALLNYSLFGGAVRDLKTGKTYFSGANATLDARVFSKLGVLQQTAIVGTTIYNRDANFIRLDTTYSFSHAGTATTYRAGDFISGGLAWTRPVRMGGFQIQRDFALAPGLETRPLPVISGSAAVPSTVDVYVNGIKTHSQNVTSGPFEIRNLPSLASGNGVAKVVVRDVTGREVISTLPLFDTARLLAPGVTDFSIEGGFARRDFGILSNNYYRKPIGSATVRRGMTGWLTLEGHAEAGAGLYNGGAGAVTALGPYGTLATAASFSRSKRGTGWQVYGAYNARFKWFALSLSTRRTYGNYDDLASITANLSRMPVFTNTLSPVALPAPTLALIRPPRSFDRISLSMPMPFDAKSHLNFGFVRIRRIDNRKQNLLTASLTRSLPYKASLYVTGFADIRSKGNRGLFVGLTVPLGRNITGSVSTNWDPSGGTLFAAEATRPQPQEIGTYGWRLRDAEGRHAQRLAQASYRSSYGQVEGQVQQVRNAVTATGSFEGSIAFAGGSVVPGNKVHSSFAVVDTGVPNVPVKQDNRLIGRSNSFGKLLVPNLRAYEPNRIGIDTKDLPVSYDVSETSRKVAPVRGGGVSVKFGARAGSPSAIVVFVDEKGKHIPVGAQGQIEGGKEGFIVGYDGQAYVKDLGAANVATIDLGGRECRAKFEFKSNGEPQPMIHNVVCKQDI